MGWGGFALGLSGTVDKTRMIENGVMLFLRLRCSRTLGLGEGEGNIFGAWERG